MENLPNENSELENMDDVIWVKNQTAEQYFLEKAEKMSEKNKRNLRRYRHRNLTTVDVCQPTAALSSSEVQRKNDPAPNQSENSENERFFPETFWVPGYSPISQPSSPVVDPQHPSLITDIANTVPLMSISETLGQGQTNASDANEQLTPAPRHCSPTVAQNTIENSSSTGQPSFECHVANEQPSPTSNSDLPPWKRYSRGLTNQVVVAQALKQQTVQQLRPQTCTGPTNQTGVTQTLKPHSDDRVQVLSVQQLRPQTSTGPTNQTGVTQTLKPHSDDQVLSVQQLRPQTNTGPTNQTGVTQTLKPHSDDRQQVLSVQQLRPQTNTGPTNKTIATQTLIQKADDQIQVISVQPLRQQTSRAGPSQHTSTFLPNCQENRNFVATNFDEEAQPQPVTLPRLPFMVAVPAGQMMSNMQPNNMQPNNQMIRLPAFNAAPTPSYVTPEVRASLDFARPGCSDMSMRVPGPQYPSPTQVPAYSGAGVGYIAQSYNTPAPPSSYVTPEVRASLDFARPGCSDMSMRVPGPLYPAPTQVPAYGGAGAGYIAQSYNTPAPPPSYVTPDVRASLDFARPGCSEMSMRVPGLQYPAPTQVPAHSGAVYIAQSYNTPAPPPCYVTPEVRASLDFARPGCSEMSMRVPGPLYPAPTQVPAYSGAGAGYIAQSYNTPAPTPSYVIPEVRASLDFARPGCSDMSMRVPGPQYLAPTQVPAYSGAGAGYIAQSYNTPAPTPSYVTPEVRASLDFARPGCSDMSMRVPGPQYPAPTQVPAYSGAGVGYIAQSYNAGFERPVPPPPPYICSSCKKAYKNSTGLKNHRKRLCERNSHDSYHMR